MIGLFAVKNDSVTKGFWKKLGQNIAILTSSLAILFFAAELTVRWLAPDVCTHHQCFNQGVFCRSDPLLGWIGISGASGAMAPPPGSKDMQSMPVTMNSEGFIDDSHHVRKPEGIKRILFLGDSFTAGVGGPRESRFTDLIDKRLPPAYEILNMGMWGYSTGQELLTLEEKGLKYRPDIIVLCMFVDDLFCCHLFSVNDGLYIKPKFSVTDHGNLRLTNIPVRDNRGQSALWNMLLTRFYKLRNRFELGTEYQRRGWLSVFDKTYLENDGYYLGLNLLAQIALVAEAHHAKFLVVIIPWKEQVSVGRFRQISDYAAIPLNRLCLNLPQRVVARFCRQRDITVLDLLPAFKEKSRSTKLFFQNDLHWTKEGHRLAADQILASLKTLDVE